MLLLAGRTTKQASLVSEQANAEQQEQHQQQQLQSDKSSVSAWHHYKTYQVDGLV